MSLVTIIEDVPLQARLLQAYFRQIEGVETIVFHDPREAVTWFESNEPDLIVLDLLLPHMHGLEVLTFLRGREHLLEIPVVVVSGEEEREVLYQAMERGANDFLRKPVDPLELLARSRNMLKLRHRQLEIARINENLYRLATVDALTQIPNRRHFLERLHTEVDRARRTRDPLSLVMVDADHFKSVNDTYGHAIGDDVLVALADTLSSSIRAIDQVGRLGGEEFAILMPSTPSDGALIVAERVGDAVRALAIPVPDGSLKFTISMGLTEFSSHDPTDNAEALLQRSDEALYSAKERGRDRVERFVSPPSQAEAC